MSRAAAVLALVLSLAGLACQEGARSDDRANVVVIVVDTLRADHLGCYGYERDTSPSIDALARESIRFERAYATGPWTKPTMNSIATGLYPSHHGADRMSRKLPSSAHTLAEALRGHGYRTGGVVSHVLLGKKFGMDQGFELYDESEAKGHHYISTPGVTRLARAMLSELASDRRPFFLFVHFFDPHDTYRPHAEIDFASARAGRISAGMASPGLRRLSPPLRDPEVQLLRDLYDEEIRFTDRGIGQLLADLGEKELLDRTLVVLTADHGEEFLERGWLGHGTSMHEELLHVPLLIRMPGEAREARVAKEPVSVVGIMPTILDVVGVDGDGSAFDGTSFFHPGASEAPIYAELNYLPVETGRKIPGKDDPWLRAVIEGDYKMTYDRLEDRARLYDVGRDPGETKDLAASKPEVASRLRERLLSAPNPRSEKRLSLKTTSLTEAQREQLRQLGYTE